MSLVTSANSYLANIMKNSKQSLSSKRATAYVSNKTISLNLLVLSVDNNENCCSIDGIIVSDLKNLNVPVSAGHRENEYVCLNVMEGIDKSIEEINDYKQKNPKSAIIPKNRVKRGTMVLREGNNIRIFIYHGKYPEKKSANKAIKTGDICEISGVSVSFYTKKNKLDELIDYQSINGSNTKIIYHPPTLEHLYTLLTLFCPPMFIAAFDTLMPSTDECERRKNNDKHYAKFEEEKKIRKKLWYNIISDRERKLASSRIIWDSQCPSDKCTKLNYAVSQPTYIHHEGIENCFHYSTTSNNTTINYAFINESYMVAHYGTNPENTDIEPPYVYRVKVRTPPENIADISDKNLYPKILGIVKLDLFKKLAVVHAKYIRRIYSTWVDTDNTCSDPINNTSDTGDHLKFSISLVANNMWSNIEEYIKEFGLPVNHDCVFKATKKYWGSKLPTSATDEKSLDLKKITTNSNVFDVNPLNDSVVCIPESRLKLSSKKKRDYRILCDVDLSPDIIKNIIKLAQDDLQSDDIRNTISDWVLNNEYTDEMKDLGLPSSDGIIQLRNELYSLNIDDDQNKNEDDDDFHSINSDITYVPYYIRNNNNNNNNDLIHKKEDTEIPQQILQYLNTNNCGYIEGSPIFFPFEGGEKYPIREVPFDVDIECAKEFNQRHFGNNITLVSSQDHDIKETNENNIINGDEDNQQISSSNDIINNDSQTVDMDIDNDNDIDNDIDDTGFTYSQQDTIDNDNDIDDIMPSQSTRLTGVKRKRKSKDSKNNSKKKKTKY